MKASFTTESVTNFLEASRTVTVVNVQSYLEDKNWMRRENDCIELNYDSH